MVETLKDNAPCILLVSHSSAFLTLARQILKGTTARIIEATRCEEALEACRRDAPQLIYLAAGLPEPGGIECCLRIKSDPEFNQIPVVLMAKDADGERSTLSRRSNCDAIIGMPPNKKNFLAIGRSFLAGFREHRHDCRLPAKLLLNGTMDSCQTLDISSNGAFLAHQDPPALGYSVQVELQLVHDGELGPRISCKGQVAWVNTETEPIKPKHPPGFGISFSDLEPRDAAVLNGFLKTLAGTMPPREELSTPLFS